MRKVSVFILIIGLLLTPFLHFNRTITITYGNQNRIATGRITASTLNVRSEPNTNARRIGTLSHNATVDIFERNINNHWHKIRLNNQWGYIHANYVTVTNEQTSTVGRATVNVSTLNVRSEASTGGRRVGTLSQGTTVDVYEAGINREWLKIKHNNNWAYIHGNFVTMINNSQNSNPNPSNDLSGVTVSRGKVTASSLNVRSTASTSGQRIGTLNQGSIVEIVETGINRHWLKIRHNNDLGYIHSGFVSLLDSESPNNVIGKGRVTATTLNVRNAASTSGTRIGTLAQGATFEIFETGVNNHWLKIKINNQWGYIHGDFVAITQEQTDRRETTTSKGRVVASSLNVREQPNGTSTRIGSLRNGTVVDIYDTVNQSWYKIKLNQQWGYIHRDFVTLINSSQLDTSSLRNKTIVLDPGHGGRDPGAVAFGLRESDIVLDISLMLEEKLKAAGANVVMTRRTDTFVSLSQRRAIATNHSTDVFVSLHINSSTANTAHGTETYWNRKHASANSKSLADSVHQQLILKLGTRDRGVREGNFEIIQHTQKPSILVELGFISNQNEANRLASKPFQEETAQAIVEGLVEYFNN
ncbi:MAG: SH3 domain-containing protein [Bacillaceae bacterium]|nr:SH3 domain-containing protein [Bacillaceae bacterium]